MSKKYYVERKADNVWVVAAEDGSDAQEFNEHGRAVRHCIAMSDTEAQAEIARLTNQRDVAIKHIAEWCVAIQQNGTSWDDWDEYYKKACCRDNALPEIRSALNAAIATAKEGGAA